MTKNIKDINTNKKKKKKKKKNTKKKKKKKKKKHLTYDYIFRIIILNNLEKYSKNLSNNCTSAYF